MRRVRLRGRHVQPAHYRPGAVPFGKIQVLDDALWDGRRLQVGRAGLLDAAAAREHVLHCGPRILKDAGRKVDLLRDDRPDRRVQAPQEPLHPRPAQRAVRRMPLGQGRPRAVVGGASRLVELGSPAVDHPLGLFLVGALRAEPLVVVVQAHPYRVAGEPAGIRRKVPLRLGRRQQLRRARRQGQVAVDAVAGAGRPHAVRRRGRHDVDAVLARQQRLVPERVRKRPVGGGRHGGGAVARANLYLRPGDGVPRVVDDDPAHGWPLPLRQRRVDDLDRDQQIPQHGGVGRGRGGHSRGRGRGGNGGDGGRCNPQGRRIHAHTPPRRR